jgi:hypothetical protein
MTFELIYDVGSTSDAPRYALGLSAGVTLVTTVWWVWLKLRGHSLHSGAIFSAVVALVLLALGIGLRVEQKYLSDRRDCRTVEGPLMGHWVSHVRRAGSQRDYWSWEGFNVGDVEFAYIRNLEENYFHNGGRTALDLQEGMLVRVRYIEDHEGSKVRNRILRVERAID